MNYDPIPMPTSNTRTEHGLIAHTPWYDENHTPTFHSSADHKASSVAGLGSFNTQPMLPTPTSTIDNKEVGR